MNISATVKNTRENHQAVVGTNGNETRINIQRKTRGRGSGVNGGELLLLSLATCYCNDIFREAESLGIAVDELEVSVDGKFEGRGEPAKNLCFDVRISADAPDDKISALLQLTDSVAEIQNTLRIAVPVSLRHTEIVRPS